MPSRESASAFQEVWCIIVKPNTSRGSIRQSLPSCLSATTFADACKATHGTFAWLSTQGHRVLIQHSQGNINPVLQTPVIALTQLLLCVEVPLTQHAAVLLNECTASTHNPTLHGKVP